MPDTLNPTQLTYFADVVWHWAEVFLPQFLGAMAILIGGFIGARWVQRAVRKMLGHVGHMDPTLKPILAALVYYAIVILVVIGALSQLGIQTASLFAVLGAAGLAIGLALQGTLSNIAAGLMLLWLRPFHVGDYIEVGGQGGAVEEIGLFVCTLRTFDGLFLFLPNSAIWNAPLKNHTRNGGRLVSVDIYLPAAADLDRARQALLDVAAKTPAVLRAPEPAVFVQNFIGGALVLSLAVWTTPQGAGTVERAVIEGAKRALEALGESFRPTQITRIVPPDADPSRFLASRDPVQW